MMVLLLGLMFVSGMQPVSMAINLIIITLVYSVYMYYNVGSFWFSYIMLMVMLSGVMVVFMYMISMMPDEVFEIYNLVYILIGFILIVKIMESLYWNDTSFVSLSLWIKLLSLMNMFMVSVLLVLMIMVVWVSNLDIGAVRVM